LHSSPPYCLVHVAFEDEGGERGNQVSGHADANQRDAYGEHAPAGRMAEIDNFAITDSGDGDEGHVQGVQP
jgi:hypothetical protein